MHRYGAQVHIGALFCAEELYRISSSCLRKAIYMIFIILIHFKDKGARSNCWHKSCSRYKHN